MFQSGAEEMSLSLRVSDLRRRYEPTDPTDHEYADLNELSSKQRAQAHDRAPHPPRDGRQPTTGDYELTQCLAYGAFTHNV